MVEGFDDDERTSWISSSDLIFVEPSGNDSLFNVPHTKCLGTRLLTLSSLYWSSGIFTCCARSTLDCPISVLFNGHSST